MKRNFARNRVLRTKVSRILFIKFAVTYNTEKGGAFYGFFFEERERKNARCVTQHAEHCAVRASERARAGVRAHS